MTRSALRVAREFHAGVAVHAGIHRMAFSATREILFRAFVFGHPASGFMRFSFLMAAAAPGVHVAEITTVQIADRGLAMGFGP